MAVVSLLASLAPTLCVYSLTHAISNPLCFWPHRMSKFTPADWTDFSLRQEIMVIMRQ